MTKYLASLTGIGCLHLQWFNSSSEFFLAFKRLQLKTTFTVISH